MKIVITGPKGIGKSTVGKVVAEQLGIPHVETDQILEQEYNTETGENHSCRDIHKICGETSFRQRESHAIMTAADKKYCVISTGGATLLNPENRRILRRDSLLVYLKGDADMLWSRLFTKGIPSFLISEDRPKEFAARVKMLDEVILPYSDITICIEADEPPESVSKRVIDRVGEEMLLSSSRFSTTGHFLKVHTFGESHGPAVGAIIDGVPAGVPISEECIQKELDRRRPGQSKVTTTRSEPDQVRILSGVFEGQTTGTPMAMLVENKHQHSRDYEAFRDVFRPGHADFTYWAKYGIRDHRGGGRSSGRETAARVMGGAVAKYILSEKGISIIGYALEIGGIRAQEIDHSIIESNSVRCPDAAAATAMEKAIISARENGDSLGGIIQLEISGIQAGLGDPVFAKLDARLGGAFFSVGAVKGVEFGAGFESARMKGSENNDPMRDSRFVSNNAGGILGGISTGETIVARVAIKPTPSIGVRQETCNTRGENCDLEIGGRHDPCIVPRAVPVIESMAAIVLLDCILLQENLRR